MTWSALSPDAGCFNGLPVQPSLSQTSWSNEPIPRVSHPSRKRPALHNGNPFGVHLKTLGLLNVTQQVQLRLHGSSMGQLCIHLTLPEHLKHNPDMLHMLLTILAEMTMSSKYIKTTLLMDSFCTSRYLGHWSNQSTTLQSQVMWHCECRLGYNLRLEPDLVV